MTALCLVGPAPATATTPSTADAHVLPFELVLRCPPGSGGAWGRADVRVDVSSRYNRKSTRGIDDAIAADWSARMAMAAAAGNKMLFNARKFRLHDVTVLPDTAADADSASTTTASARLTLHVGLTDYRAHISIGIAERIGLVPPLELTSPPPPQQQEQMFALGARTAHRPNALGVVRHSGELVSGSRPAAAWEE